MAWRGARRGLFAVVALAPALAYGQSAGEGGESPIHALARLAGLATNPPPPPDFVRDSRADAPHAYIPAFRPFDEPTSKVKSKDDLKAMANDLDKTDEAHDKLRSAFPPSAEAMAAKKAAQDAKKAAQSRPVSSPQN